MKLLWLGILLGGIHGTTWAGEPLAPLDLGGGVRIELARISAGEFLQSSPGDEAGRGADEDRRQVRLTSEFYISRTAVTRGQWERFIAETGYRTEAEGGKSGGYGWDGNALVQRKDFTWKSPGFPQDASHPVCLVTFPDAQAFCQWLARKSGRQITLPTEARWEYACRAGTTSPWHSGNETSAWHKGNSGNGTHPVDSTPPNPWGVIIGGNVSEWCLDWYAPYVAGHITDPCQDNPNLSDKPRRVLRGGSWNRDAKNTRSAARFRADPRSRNADIGFRIVCEPVVHTPIVEAPLEASSNQPTSPDPETPPPISSPPAGFRSSSSSKWSGLLCLFIPVGLLILIVRLITRSKSANAFTNPQSTPPPLKVHPGVRMVDNGFWIHSDWPVGTPLHLSYLLNGVMEQHELVYQPGAQGQFVFTGQRPDKVTVSTAGDLPPPLPVAPTPLFDRDDDHFRRSQRPSFNPPAY